MKQQTIQGTPWTIGYGDRIKDARRHKKRCIYYRSINKYGKKINYCSYCLSNCIGSAHCGMYNEEERKNYYESISPTICVCNTINNNSHEALKKTNSLYDNNHKRFQIANDTNVKSKPELKNCLIKILSNKALNKKELFRIVDKRKLSLTSIETDLLHKLLRVEKQYIDDLIVACLQKTRRGIVLDFKKLTSLSNGKINYSFSYNCSNNKIIDKNIKKIITQIFHRIGIRIIYKNKQSIRINDEERNSFNLILNKIYIDRKRDYSSSVLEYTIKKSTKSGSFFDIVFDQTIFKRLIRQNNKNHIEN